jgi:hypothetical protein
MSDGFKYVDISYQTNQALPSFKVELEITSIYGKVVFSTLFYSDEAHTQYLGETSNQDVVLGSNVFESNSLQYGNMSLYVIGRIKILQGSTLGLSSFKINDVAHIESGSMKVDIPPITFTETLVNQTVYQSFQLGLVQDPHFQIVLVVKEIIGVIGFEYLYYNDETYTTLSSIQSANLVLGTNTFPVDTVNKYVLLRFKMTNGNNMILESFSLQQIQQFSETETIPISTPYYVQNIAIVSETCFPANTLVKTDQGTLPIQKLVPHQHTIQGKLVVALTSTYCSDKELVHLRKDSIRKNYPNRDTLISKKHKIYMKGKLKAAYRLVDSYKGVSLVPYKGQMLFNVLLEEYGLMNVQGMMCETLHPLNPMATLFRELYKIESHPSLCVQ